MSQDSNRRIERWGLVLCLFVALGLRALVIGLHSTDLMHDRDAYLGIAEGIAEGRGYCIPGTTRPTAYRPPLYPILLGCLTKCMPTAVAVAGVNLCFGLLTVWATFQMGRQLALGSSASLAAAALVAIDPLLLQYSSQPMTETICTGLVALLLLLLLCDASQHHGRDWWLGILFGLLVLCRPTFWPVAGLISLPWLMSRVRHFCLEKPCGWLAICRSLIDDVPWRIFLGTLVVVTPWILRNQCVLNSPLLTTTHGGYTLLLANNPVFYREVVDQPWGTTWSGPSLGKWQAELNERLQRDLGLLDTEVARDRRQGAMALDFIRQEPYGFIRASGFRFRSLWSAVPLGDGRKGSSEGKIIAVRWFYRLTLSLFAVGLIMTVGRAFRTPWWSLYAFVITVQAVHLFYWTNTRMRAPLTPLIALFSVSTVLPRRESSPKNR